MLALILAQITETATKYKIPPKVLIAMARVESSLRHKVVVLDDGGSPSFGLFQVKLSTARQVGLCFKKCDLLDIKLNVTAAAKYLRWQLERYDWDIRKAVSAYNAGTFRGNYNYWLKVEKHL